MAAAHPAQNAALMRLWADNLTCVRGGRTVFSGITLSVSAGEAMVLTGRNGAGKSSLLRLIAGLLTPSAGRLGLDGGNPDATIGEQLHYLGHQDALKPSLTVLENLSFWAAYLGGKPSASALDEVGLAPLADLPAAYLSAGQRRRLSLARLIVAKRPIWLLDEPASSLDTAAQQQLGSLMRRHRAEGGMIVAAVHGPIGLDAARELSMERAA